MTAPTRTEVRRHHTPAVRPEFAHMAAAMRHLATGYDASGQPELAAEFRYRAALLTLPDLCDACGMDPTGQRETPAVPIDGREVDRAPAEVLTASAIERVRDALPDRFADRPYVMSREERDRYFGEPEPPAPAHGLNSWET